MRIVDAHHHLWDLQANYYPWLTDRVHQVRYGDYAPIRRDYRLTEFKADIGTLPVVKSVHVQAGHDETDPVRETRWLQALSDQHGSGGFPHAIVAFVDLSLPNAREVIAAQAAFRNVRGVRQMLHAGPAAGYLDLPHWRATLGALVEAGLRFDMQIYPRQMQSAAALADEHPGLSIILDHAGCPLRDGADWRAEWDDGMRRLAARPNVSVKLSGFGMFERDWTVATLRPLVLRAIELFGIERCLFASNYPVDGLMASYRAIWDAFLEIAEAFDAAEREQLFAGNAERLYAI